MTAVSSQANNSMIIEYLQLRLCSVSIEEVVKITRITGLVLL